MKIIILIEKYTEKDDGTEISRDFLRRPKNKELLVSSFKISDDKIVIKVHGLYEDNIIKKQLEQTFLYIKEKGLCKGEKRIYHHLEKVVLEKAILERERLFKKYFKDLMIRHISATDNPKTHKEIFRHLAEKDLTHVDLFDKYFDSSNFNKYS